MQQSSELENIQVFITNLISLLGIFLIFSGTVLLAYIGVLALQVINSPEEVKIVHFVLEQVQIDHTAISGEVDGQSFEMSLGEPLKTAIFLMLGLLCLNFLASIVKVLVITGVQLVKTARGAPKPSTSKEKK